MRWVGDRRLFHRGHSSTLILQGPVVYSDFRKSFIISDLQSIIRRPVRLFKAKGRLPGFQGGGQYLADRLQ